MLKNKSMLVPALLVTFINIAASTAMHVLADVAKGSHGAPSFLTPAFVVFGAASSLLLIGAYLLLGPHMPVKNKLLRALLFILLFWSSDYLSQILGALGGDSPVLQTSAFSFSTILFDSLGYLITGIFMGLLLDFKETAVCRKCESKKLLAACLASMLLFPALVFILEMAAGGMQSELYCYRAFGISEHSVLPFYIVFYACLAFSGLLFPLFYRVTEYNSAHAKKWRRFAGVYGWMLWAPIVLIVIFFGIPALPTIVFTLTMVFSIYVDCFVFDKLMAEKQDAGVLRAHS